MRLYLSFFFVGWEKGGKVRLVVRGVSFFFVFGMRIGFRIFINVKILLFVVGCKVCDFYKKIKVEIIKS